MFVPLMIIFIIAILLPIHRSQYSHYMLYIVSNRFSWKIVPRSDSAGGIFLIPTLQHVKHKTIDQGDGSPSQPNESKHCVNQVICGNDETYLSIIYMMWDSQVPCCWRGRRHSQRTSTRAL